MAKAGVVLAAGAGIALAAVLRHAATEFPADKELGPWSSYFSLNSQVKLVRNPVYHSYISSQLDALRQISACLRRRVSLNLLADTLADDVVGNVPPTLWHHTSLWSLVKVVASRGETYEEAAATLQKDATAGDIDLRNIAFKDESSAEAKLIKQVRIIPEWVNGAELEKGRQVHEMNAIAIGTVLLCGSLVLSYACKNGNKVLMETRRLSASVEGVWRRLAETWHFVVQIQHSDDALAHGHVGFDSVLNVRLLHSVVRRYCQRKEWNTTVYGLPINQEDMLGTLASFSPCVLIGLEKVGMRITLDEQDAYCARWRYVGYLLGLTPEALGLIANYHSSRYVGEVIALRQLSPDEDSAKLTSYSLQAVENHYPVLSNAPKPLRNVLSYAVNVRKPGGITTVAWAVVRLLLRLGPFLCRRFPLFRPIWISMNNFYQGRVSRSEFSGKKRINHSFKTA